MTLTRTCAALALMAATWSASQPAHAAPDFEHIETGVQYAYALDSSQDKVLGYGADSRRLGTLRFQHESAWRYGNNFLLVDFLRSNRPLGGPVFGPDDPANFSYGPGKSTWFWVGESELLGSRVFGTSVGTGLFKDWGLSGRLERGGYYDFRAHEIGPRVHLNVPGLDVFKLALWRRWKTDVSGTAGQQGFDVGNQSRYATSWLVGMDLKASWELWGLRWTSQTFVRWQPGQGGKASARGNENINGIPARLWVEPDVFVHLNKHVAIGLRDYFLWQKDAIDNGYSSEGRNSHHVPQLVLKASYF